MVDEESKLIIKWKAKVEANVPSLLKTHGGYTIEQIFANRNCSKNPKYWFNIHGTDRYLFRSSVAESWEFTLPNVENPIKNMDQIYLRFLDTSEFTMEANTFLKEGKYNPHLEGSPLFNQYWDNQEKFCFQGKVVDGVRISGRYYFMCNFSRMTARPKDKNGKVGKRKIETFPWFTDHQYYLANEIEFMMLDTLYESEVLFKNWFPLATDKDFDNLEKQSATISKARRKGLTFFVANAIYLYNYTLIAESYNIIGAYIESFYDTILDEGLSSGIQWVTQNTRWNRVPEVLSQRDNYRASAYIKDAAGKRTKMEGGMMSEIKCISFSGNAFKAVGRSAYVLGIEEAGKFNNLLKMYPISIEPLLRDGEIKIGSSFIWGTAGEMDGSGGSLGLYHMTYNPAAMGFRAYSNIYEQGGIASGESGLFIDDLWFTPSKFSKTELLTLVKDPYERDFILSIEGDYVSGFDTDTGNSLRFIAKLILLDKRRKKKKSTDASGTYESFLSQQPLYLSEAFYVDENSPFDLPTIKEAKVQLLARESQLGFKPGLFADSIGGGVLFREDRTLTPIFSYDRKSDKMAGCWVIYDDPVYVGGEILPRRYIAGTDPIDSGYEEANSDNLHSLAATYIMDTWTGNIVAEYVGRPALADTYFEQLLRGLEYYNATTMYENNLKGLHKYAAYKKKLALLANEPRILKTKVGYKSTGGLTKGFHAAGNTINPYLRQEVHAWLSEKVEMYDFNGELKLVKRYFTIDNMAILEELERWNNKGNFDRVSALMALILYRLEIGENAIPSKTAAETPNEKDDLFAHYRKIKKIR